VDHLSHHLLDLLVFPAKVILLILELGAQHLVLVLVEVKSLLEVDLLLVELLFVGVGKAVGEVSSVIEILLGLLVGEVSHTLQILIRLSE
jgi:hypothetical protein